VDIRATAMRALDLSFIDVGDVVVLGEFLVAVLTMKDVLRHGVSPANMIAPIVVDGCEFGRCGGDSWQTGKGSDDAESACGREVYATMPSTRDGIVGWRKPET
jgi:hypothetical protein